MNNKDIYGILELRTFLRDELKINEQDPFPQIIEKQIAKYILNDGFSYKEIARCVYYYIEEKKGSYNDLYGIWFVQRYRDQAARYWAEIEKRQAERREDAKKFETKGGTVVFNVQQILKNRTKPYRLEPLKFDDIVERNGDDDDRHQ